MGVALLKIRPVYQRFRRLLAWKRRKKEPKTTSQQETYLNVRS